MRNVFTCFNTSLTEKYFDISLSVSLNHYISKLGMKLHPYLLAVEFLLILGANIHICIRSEYGFLVDLKIIKYDIRD